MFRLLLDMDGVIAGFDHHFFAEASAAGIEFDVAAPHMQTARYITDHVVLEQRKGGREMTYRPGWFRAFPVMEGAQAGVDALLSAGVDIWVCTKPLERNPTCRDEKGAWLVEHFPMLEKKLIITPDKSLIKGHVLLDDAPKIKWIGFAEWYPMIFRRSFNGEGTLWENIPHWDWQDDIRVLLDYGSRIARHGDRSVMEAQ
jgi:5'-nucleotidase